MKCSESDYLGAMRAYWGLDGYVLFCQNINLRNGSTVANAANRAGDVIGSGN